MMKVQKVFSGFEEENIPSIAVPRRFIEELMHEITDINEIKVILTVFHLLQIGDGIVKFIRINDLYRDENLVSGLICDEDNYTNVIRNAIQQLVARGIILVGTFNDPPEVETLIFLNTPLGRASVEALAKGQWKIDPRTTQVLPQPSEFANIFKLYENHIGPLTPMMVDTLKDAEQTYPINWIEEAIRLAVENNKRSWRYVAAILKRWKEEGKGERKTGQDTKEVLRKYAEQWKRPTDTRGKK
ncbi:MAG: DnaD domain-containing protein [Anaerolineales bacterium]